MTFFQLISSSSHLNFPRPLYYSILYFIHFFLQRLIKLSYPFICLEIKSCSTHAAPGFYSQMFLTNLSLPVVHNFRSIRESRFVYCVVCSYWLKIKIWLNPSVYILLVLVTEVQRIRVSHIGALRTTTIHPDWTRQSISHPSRWWNHRYCFEKLSASSLKPKTLLLIRWKPTRKKPQTVSSTGFEPPDIVGFVNAARSSIVRTPSETCRIVYNKVPTRRACAV